MGNWGGDMKTREEALDGSALKQQSKNTVCLGPDGALCTSAAEEALPPSPSDNSGVRRAFDLVGRFFMDSRLIRRESPNHSPERDDLLSARRPGIPRGPGF